MINLIGGPLFQWDIDRQLKVLNKEITEMNFCNQHHCDSQVVQVVDGMCTVPNTLLQTHHEIEVYGCVGDEEVYSTTLEVNSRRKPKDYPLSVGGSSTGGSGGGVYVIEVDYDTLISGSYDEALATMENGGTVYFKYNKEYIKATAYEKDASTDHIRGIFADADPTEMTIYIYNLSRDNTFSKKIAYINL